MRERKREERKEESAEVLRGVGARCELDGCGSLHATAQRTAVVQQQQQQRQKEEETAAKL